MQILDVGKSGIPKITDPPRLPPTGTAWDAARVVLVVGARYAAPSRACQPISALVGVLTAGCASAAWSRAQICLCQLRSSAVRLSMHNPGLFVWLRCICAKWSTAIWKVTAPSSNSDLGFQRRRHRDQLRCA